MKRSNGGWDNGKSNSCNKNNYCNDNIPEKRAITNQQRQNEDKESRIIFQVVLVDFFFAKLAI
ncbi:MAG: hypothetical protein R2759_14785 [Bacteroidales bacterium]